MSDDLGLDELTDDQLIELARAVAREIGLRDPGVYAAAFVAAQAVRPPPPRARAGDNPAYGWAIARRAAMMIEETLGTGWTFGVWKSDHGERRVYLDMPARNDNPVRRQYKPHTIKSGKVIHYASGGMRGAAGTTDHQHVPAGTRFDRVEAICRFLEEAWDTWPTTKVATALASTIAPAPVPPFYR